MELADVLDSKSSGSDTVRVRPPPPAPNTAVPHRGHCGIFVVRGRTIKSGLPVAGRAANAHTGCRCFAPKEQKQTTPATSSSRTAYRSRRLFCKKSSLIHSVAPPLQTEPAALGFGLVLGADLNVRASIVTLCNRQMHRLVFALSGWDLQSLYEMRTLMESTPMHGTREQNFFRLDDGSVWRFSEESVCAAFPQR